ncbi:CIA30 family protein [Yoonia sp. 208BN28-4]|uniref:CIA30 family protein n=1 Tax=Yoonia sp. 208BN28-4 TaxID=3126505 RepID=UPI00309DBAE8
MEPLDLNWEFVADTVMGGVSSGQITQEQVAGRAATRLTGDVSLDNNGGFIQMAADLRDDVSAWTGIAIDVIGNEEDYDVRLRTDQLSRPWQSFRTGFQAPAQWTTIRFPFATFESNNTEARFDPAQLRRIGILAVGEVMEADIAVAQVALY